MTEPTTEAGRRLVAALGHPESTVVPSSVIPAIRAIEAEATAAAEQRLRELTGTYRTAVLALEAIDVERLSRSLPEHYENDRDSHHSCLAYAESVAAEYALLDAPPPASPRQGEPVADHHVFLNGKCCCGEVEPAKS